MEEHVETRRECLPREETRAVQPLLFRHPSHRLIGGVCGGLADYLNLDATLVRILWVVLTLGTAGGGFLAYLALWMLLPVGTTRTGMQEPAALELNERNIWRAGMVLIGLGVFWLLANVGVLPWLWSAFWQTVGLLFWPVLLIGAGLLLINNQQSWRSQLQGWRKRMGRGTRSVRDSVHLDRNAVKGGVRRAREAIPFKRSRTDRIFFGVCGAIAGLLHIDANLVRLIWVAFSIGSIGTGVLLYVLAGLLLPEEDVDAHIGLYDDDPQNVQIIDGTASS